MDVELWKTPDRKQATGFRALLYDAKEQKLKVPVNSKSAEVSRNTCRRRSRRLPGSPARRARAPSVS